MTWLTFESKQFQNGRLVAILNFNTFCDIYVTKKNAKLLDHEYKRKSNVSHKGIFRNNKVHHDRRRLSAFNFFSHYLRNLA